MSLQLPSSRADQTVWFSQQTPLLKDSSYRCVRPRPAARRELLSPAADPAGQPCLASHDGTAGKPSSRSQASGRPSASSGGRSPPASTTTRSSSSTRLPAGAAIAASSRTAARHSCPSAALALAMLAASTLTPPSGALIRPIAGSLKTLLWRYSSFLSLSDPFRACPHPARPSPRSLPLRLLTPGPAPSLRRPARLASPRPVPLQPGRDTREGRRPPPARHPGRL